MTLVILCKTLIRRRRRILIETVKPCLWNHPTPDSLQLPLEQISIIIHLNLWDRHLTLPRTIVPPSISILDSLRTVLKATTLLEHYHNRAPPHLIIIHQELLSDVGRR